MRAQGMLELVVNNTQKHRLSVCCPELVYLSSNPVDVVLAKVLLGGAGIPFATVNEQAHCIYPGVLPAYFFVEHTDAADARFILSTYEADKRRNSSHLQPV